MFLRFEVLQKRKKIRSDCKDTTARRIRRLKDISLMPCKRVAMCICDTCNHEFAITDHVEKKAARKYHFCSRSCKSKAQSFGHVLYKEDCYLAHTDILAISKIASHTQIANDRRSLSLKKFHENKPKDWKNPGNTPEACVKRHKTMKKNNSYRKSSPEDRMFEYLIEKFGEYDVTRNELVNSKWPIDFYIKSIDLYVQLDGVYWHGLDRPIDVIAEHKSKRDVQIHKKWKIDREQEQWFEKNKLKLMRITDVEFKNGRRP